MMDVFWGALLLGVRLLFCLTPDKICYRNLWWTTSGTPCTPCGSVVCHPCVWHKKIQANPWKIKANPWKIKANPRNSRTSTVRKYSHDTLALTWSGSNQIVQRCSSHRTRRGLLRSYWNSRSQLSKSKHKWVVVEQMSIKESDKGAIGWFVCLGKQQIRFRPGAGYTA